MIMSAIQAYVLIIPFISLNILNIYKSFCKWIWNVSDSQQFYIIVSDEQHSRSVPDKILSDN
jgi:hypothetical protein